jgi:hypothetical protein
MKYIKTFESNKRNEFKEFAIDLGYFLTLNTAKIQTFAKDEDSKKELKEMQEIMRKPLINGKTYTSLIDDLNTIILNPTFTSAFLLQCKKILEYIEPRIVKYVKDCDYKDKWLKMIDNMKQKYIAIVKN